MLAIYYKAEKKNLYLKTPSLQKINNKESVAVKIGLLTYNVSGHKDHNAHDDGADPVQADGSVALPASKHCDSVCLGYKRRSPE